MGDSYRPQRETRPFPLEPWLARIRSETKQNRFATAPASRYIPRYKGIRKTSRGHAGGHAELRPSRIRTKLLWLAVLPSCDRFQRQQVPIVRVTVVLRLTVNETYTSLALSQRTAITNYAFYKSSMGQIGTEVGYRKRYDHKHISQGSDRRGTTKAGAWTFGLVSSTHTRLNSHGTFLRDSSYPSAQVC